MKKNKWIIIGLIFIILSICISGFNIYKNEQARNNSARALEKLKTVITNQKDTCDKSHSSLKVEEVNNKKYIGIIEMPSLDLYLPVLNEWTKANGDIAPCYYGGNISDNLIICAHNSNAHFGKIVDLHQNDEVNFIDISGNKYTYIVMDIYKINPDDIETVTSKDYDLTLFTCTYLGEKRVAVKLKMVCR